MRIQQGLWSGVSQRGQRSALARSIAQRLLHSQTGRLNPVVRALMASSVLPASSRCLAVVVD